MSVSTDSDAAAARVAAARMDCDRLHRLAADAKTASNAGWERLQEAERALRAAVEANVEEHLTQPGCPCAGTPDQEDCPHE